MCGRCHTAFGDGRRTYRPAAQTQRPVQFQCPGTQTWAVEGRGGMGSARSGGGAVFTITAAGGSGATTTGGGGGGPRRRRLPCTTQPPNPTHPASAATPHTLTHFFIARPS